MNALVIILIIIAVAAAVVFGVGGFFVGNLTRKKSTENTIGSAQQEANRILSEANKSAEAAKKEALLQGREDIQKLRESTEQFDLIFIDPPTFSNSKRMEDAFDVQRDHIRLMTDLKRLLRKGGTIMFSNNKRGFRMDHDGLAALGLKAQEISQKTLSQDFARNRQMHNCWLITAA